MRTVFQQKMINFARKKIYEEFFNHSERFCPLSSCQQSLEDRAAKEMAEYTRKNCPTPVVNNENVDSATFEPSTRTVHYYYKLHGEIDNALLS